MIKKFVKITGLHNVFNVSDSDLDITSIKEEMQSEINQNSILFLTASEDTLYGYPDGTKYIWTMNTLYPTNSYDEIIKEDEEVIATAITTMANTLGLNSSLNVEWSEESGIPAGTDYKTAIEQSVNAPQFVETTVSELRNMCDNGELTPGCKYRITDYECKVEGMMSAMYAKSVNNKYDIVIEAIDEHTLSQDAKPMNHVPEEPEHEVTEITKFKFFSDMGAGGEADIYGFMIRNKSIDDTNTSEDERMTDCQVGWSIIIECLQRQFDVDSSFGDVTSWDPYMPDTAKIFTLNSDIKAGETAYMDAAAMGGPGIIEFNILDTLEETHTEGGDYFKNCNLNAWELKYSLDLNDHRFEWISTKTGIVISAEGQRITLSRDETYDTYGKWVVNVPIEGTTYRFAYDGQGGEEESGVTYYHYNLLGEFPEGYAGVIKFTTEFPVVGDTGYFVMSDDSLQQPFTFTQDMLSTKNTAWTVTM